MGRDTPAKHPNQMASITSLARDIVLQARANILRGEGKLRLSIWVSRGSTDMEDWATLDGPLEAGEWKVTEERPGGPLKVFIRMVDSINVPTGQPAWPEIKMPTRWMLLDSSSSAVIADALAYAIMKNMLFLQRDDEDPEGDMICGLGVTVTGTDKNDLVGELVQYIDSEEGDLGVSQCINIFAALLGKAHKLLEITHSA